MTSPGAADLLRSVGLLADGPVLWGRPVRSAKPGVYLVELPAPLPTAPLDLARIGKWLERATGLLLDGTRPTSRALRERIARDWVPGATVLLAGSTGGSLAERVAALAATPAGDPLPCPDGLRLQLLRGVEACRTWWAETDAAEEYEDALLDAFAASLAPAEAASLGEFVAPFAVLRRPTGEERPTGITGELLPAPTAEPSPAPRLVHLRQAPAVRRVGAPAPRAVAADGIGGASRASPARTGSRPAGGGPAAAAAPGAGVPATAAAGAPAGRSPEEAVHLSAEGLARLEAELRELRTVRRPEIVARVAAARELGDLRENAEYHAAREELGFLDGRVAVLEGRLRAAVVVEAGESAERATLGSTVAVEVDGTERTLRLVGSAEADLAAGRISVASPVGRALIGAVAGDEVTVATPAGPAVYRVVRVE